MTIANQQEKKEIIVIEGNDGGDFGRYPCEDEDMWDAECCQYREEENHSRENGTCYWCPGCVGGCGSCCK